MQRISRKQRPVPLVALVMPLATAIDIRQGVAVATIGFVIANTSIIDTVNMNEDHHRHHPVLLSFALK